MLSESSAIVARFREINRVAFILPVLEHLAESYTKCDSPLGRFPASKYNVNV